MTPEAIVEQTLAVYLEAPTRSMRAAYQALATRGVPDRQAWEAAHVVPSAFARVYIERHGVTLRCTYVVEQAPPKPGAAQQPTEILIDDPTYQLAYACARSLPDPELLHSVAQRSAEFSVFLDFMKATPTPQAEPLAITTVLPAYRPPASTPWWKLWKRT